MLKKMVDGIEVICSESEENLIRKFWAINDKYPEYHGHCAFDGISEPYHIMDNVKATHTAISNAYYEKQIANLSLQIEIAREDRNTETEQTLLGQRKALRSKLNPDLSGITDIEYLYSLLPEPQRGK